MATTTLVTSDAPRMSAWARFTRWAGKDRVFRWVPVVPTQTLFVFMMPAFALLIYLSFINWRLTRGDWWEAPYYAVKNFGRVLTDERFVGSIGNTLLYAFSAVPVEFVLGLLLALSVSKITRGKGFFSGIFLVPMMVVPVVVGYNFTMIFSEAGPFNQLLSFVTGSEIRVNWLADFVFSKVAIILADIWQWTAFMFLMLLAGLTGIPQEPIRAAKILGANSWQIFWKITLPLLKPVIVIALVLRLLETLKVFDTVLLITGGGPGTSSESVAMTIYKVGWEYNRISRSASMALIVFFGTMILVFVCFWMVRRQQRAIEEGLV
jgi:multiple sugar transport system permease protein